MWRQLSGCFLGANGWPEATLQNHASRITHGDEVGRNIVYDDTVHAYESSLSDGDALHDVTTFSDPGVAADANRRHFFVKGGQIRDTGFGIARVSGRVHDPYPG